MRDIEKHPYSADEARVAKFFSDRGIGGGDDPIGSIMACHEYAIAERNHLKSVLAGVEVALARDEDIDGAMKLIIAARGRG
jgi:hypothetical protein